MPQSPQPRRPHSNQPVEADTARTLAHEQLAEADEIVRELFPEADQVVLADPDDPHEPGALQLRHVLDANGVVLYTADKHDALADLLETHLLDVRDTTPDTRPAPTDSPHHTAQSPTTRGFASPADVLHTTYGRGNTTPHRLDTGPRRPSERGNPHAHMPNTRHHRATTPTVITHER